MIHNPHSLCLRTFKNPKPLAQPQANPWLSMFSLAASLTQPFTPATIHRTHQEHQTPSSFSPSVNLHLAPSWTPGLLPLHRGSENVSHQRTDAGHDSAISDMVKAGLKLLTHGGSNWAEFRADPWVFICRWGFSSGAPLRDESSSTDKC